MPNVETAGGMPQQEAVKANWDALNEDFTEVVVKNEPKQESQENAQTADNAENTEIQDANSTTDPKTDENQETNQAEEKKEEPKAEKTDGNQEKSAETTDAAEENGLALTVDDIKDVPKQFEEGSWGELAKDFKLELQEDSYESFIKGINENYVPKSEFEKAKAQNLDAIYANLKPETVAALKFIEAGVPEESVFAPTRQIDQYLSLSAAELVRADYEARTDEGWTQELIDAKMEELSADPKKMALAEHEIRTGLMGQKKQIIESRTLLLQQHEQRKQAAAIAQKQQEVAQFNEALDKLQNFMGVPVSKEVREAIRAKYNNGLYSDVVSNSNAIVQAIMYKEYGDKLAKHLQNKASEAAKTETRKKLLNVPPVTGGNGKRVDINAVNQSDNNWSALAEDFKN